jgi:hypothetical protein
MGLLSEVDAVTGAQHTCAAAGAHHIKKARGANKRPPKLDLF